MALYDLDGSITGTGTTTVDEALTFGAGATASGTGAASGPLDVALLFGDSLSGTSTVSGDVERILLFSGQSAGAGVLSDTVLITLDGLLLGISSVTGDLVRVRQVAGITQGSGFPYLSVPNPLHGAAIVSAFMEVIHVPPPLCPELLKPVTTFRWQQTLTKGDLCVQITDAACNPLGPVCIDYTMYRLVQGCALHQVGCAHRVPANCGVGAYYATGCAGEGGQPGTWVIRWRYKRNFGDSFIEKDFCYEVLDSVSGPIPGDTLDRNCKYGWD